MSNKIKEKEKEKENKDKDKEKDKEKEKEKENNSKKIPIPNTLTIYIKTRIPNHTKMIYEPSMTVPTSKSHTVYFDPLVQYIKGAITDIPPKAPLDAKYTQFFEANQFDSLVNRFKSKTFNFQKNPAKLLNLQYERTLEQALEEDLINQNIQLTLSSLFKYNGLFYINKRPYTILNKQWKTDGWDVDTKTENKLTSLFSNLSYNDAQKEADEELATFKNTYSTEGSPGATENEKFEENLENLKNTPTIEVDTDHSALFNTIQGSEAFEDEQNIITQNYPIQFTNAVDKATEPITFSLLLDRNVFVIYLEEKTEKGKSLLNKYSRCHQNKEALYKIKKEYHEIFIKIGKKKGEYDDKSAEIFLILNPINSGSSSQSVQITNISKLCEDLHDLYIEFMELFITLSELLVSLYDKQILYFNSIVDFLKEFKKEYTTIIKYHKDTAELANICIETDIRIYELLSIQTDVTILDINSQLYFTNIANLKLKRDKLVKERAILSDINIQETVNKYTNDPWLLILLQNQFDIYTKTISSSFYSNQTNIWKIYYKEVEDLVNNMIKIFIIKMQETIDKEITYIEDYKPSLKTQVGFSKEPSIPIPGKTMEQTTEYLEKKYGFTGIKKNTDIVRTLVNLMQYKKAVPENKWRLINDQDMYVIKNDDAHEVDIEYERRYIDILQHEVELFDSVILITHLLQIKCLRQYGLYTAEENASQIELLMLKSYLWYYLAIKGYKDLPEDISRYSDEISTYVEYFDNNFKKNIYPSKTFQIPNSVLWNTSILNKSKNTHDFLIQMIEEIHISIPMQNYKIREIKLTNSKYITECNNFAKTVEAKMGSTNIKNTCNELLETFTNFTFTTQFVSFSMFNKDDVELKNINIRNTLKFNNNVRNQSFAGRNNIQWIVYKNKENYRTNLNDDYYKREYSENILNIKKYSAYFGERFLNIFLGAIKDILNKQLDHLNSITINLYTDVLENKNRFTINSLKRIINDNSPNTIKLLLEGNTEQGMKIYSQDSVLNDQTLNIGVKREFLNYYQTRIIELLRDVLKINIYIFDMPDTENELKLGTSVALKNNLIPNQQPYIIMKINKNKEGISYNLKNTTNNFPETKKADEITFLKKSEFDNQPFKMTCGQNQNPLVTENILFLLRTTDDIFDYNYEIIGTFLEEYVFSVDNSSIYRFFEEIYLSSCSNLNRERKTLDQPALEQLDLKTKYKEIVTADLDLKFKSKNKSPEEKLSEEQEQDKLYTDILGQYTKTNEIFERLNTEYKIAKLVYIYSKMDTNEGSKDAFSKVPALLKDANNCLAQYYIFDELIRSLLNFNKDIDIKNILIASFDKENILERIILDLNEINKNIPIINKNIPIINKNDEDESVDDASVASNTSNLTIGHMPDKLDNTEVDNTEVDEIWERMNIIVKDLKQYQLACIGSIINLNKQYFIKEKNEFKAIDAIYKALIDLFNALTENMPDVKEKEKVVSNLITSYKDFQNKKEPNKYEQIKRAYEEDLKPMIDKYIKEKNDQGGGDPKKNINRSKPRSRPSEKYIEYAKGNQVQMPYGQPQIVPYGQPQIVPYGQPQIVPYGQNQTHMPYRQNHGYNQNQIHSSYGQQNLDYYNHDFQYNISKEGKSKLSYYITVELDLYPGTDIGTVKKYAMKCQTSFEKIRKSLSDLFGYQYKPLEIKEAYAYEAEYDANMKIKEEQERDKARDLERDKRDLERDKDRERERERNIERRREREGNQDKNSRNRDLNKERKGGKSLKKYRPIKKNISFKKR